jgi:hypothetical protein
MRSFESAGYSGARAEGLTSPSGLRRQEAEQKQDAAVWLFMLSVSGFHPDITFFRRCTLPEKTESMVTPVFATPILTTSWLA